MLSAVSVMPDRVPADEDWSGAKWLWPNAALKTSTTSRPTKPDPTAVRTCVSWLRPRRAGQGDGHVATDRLRRPWPMAPGRRLRSPVATYHTIARHLLRDRRRSTGGSGTGGIRQVPVPPPQARVLGGQRQITAWRKGSTQSTTGLYPTIWPASLMSLAAVQSSSTRLGSETVTPRSHRNAPVDQPKPTI
jgi:hypothetical protein